MQFPVFNKCFLCSLFFATLMVQNARAQYEEENFILHTATEGLSDNYITCIQQDDWGYMWIGTEVGLNRFDGNQFRTYFRGSADMKLRSNYIRKLKPFGLHKLGIFSIAGFQVLNTGDHSLSNYYIPDNTPMNTYLNAVWDATELPDHSLAITTASGFYVFNSKGEVKFRHDAYTRADINKKRILYGREIFPVNEKEYIVYTDETGTAYYEDDTKSFHEITASEKKWKPFLHPEATEGSGWVCKYQLKNDEFIFVFRMKDSILFYNHTLKKEVLSPLPVQSWSSFNWESRIQELNDTLFAINDATNGFYLFNLDRTTGRIIFHPKKYFSSYKIGCLFMDKDNRLWIGTTHGLLQQKLNKSFLKSYFFPAVAKDSLSGEFTCVYRCRDKLYLGRYSRNAGLAITDTSGLHIIKLVSFFGRNNGWNEIRAIEMYYPDTLWLSTASGIIWFDTKTDHYGKLKDEKRYRNVPDGSVTFSPVRPDGYVWLCGLMSGYISRYNITTREFTYLDDTTQPALPFYRVKHIAYDAYGDIWIGGHSLTRLNTRQQLFDTLITVYAGANKFWDDILLMTADDHGSLWMHNTDNGLLEYRIKEKQFKVYTMQDGLPTDDFTNFSPVINNILWIGSNKYLTRFDTRTKKVTVYDYQDGLPDQRASGRVIYFDTESRLLYMPFSEYIVRFPLNNRAATDNSSGLLIEEITVNNSNNKASFYPGSEMRLQHDENSFSLRFTTIDFETNHYQFAWKLGDAGGWSGLGPERSINLNKLPPGKHVIYLKATGKSGNEKLKTLTLIIKPPFWKTTLFIVAISLLFSAITYYLYRKRIKQIRQKANIDRLLSQTEMKALHSQMNPHFIFNSLNSIREMILHNENKDASRYLSKFAQLIRITLDQSGQSFISLRNTIDYLQRYIEMERIRNNHFTCSIDVDKELSMDETVLPPMLIQPFIENAIWHGVPANNRKININIDFKKENDHLTCIIDDNGIGIEQSMINRKNGDPLHSSYGIANIRNRIRLLNEKYNLRSDISITDKKNMKGSAEGGTIVILHLPLEINEE